MPAMSMSGIAPVANRLGEDVKKDFPTPNDDKMVSEFEQEPKSLYEKYKDTLAQYKQIVGTLNTIFNTLYSVYVNSSNLKSILALTKVKAELEFYVSEFEKAILHSNINDALNSRGNIDKLTGKLFLYLSSLVKNLKRSNQVLFPFRKPNVEEFNFLIPDDQKYWLTKGAVETYYY